ncbi:hypothetical protein ColKHC_04611 [Colletotrichum higginsianum]|nr:hypothetical protein ColKHC_04611 [Colletotrichum higginsianum]
MPKEPTYGRCFILTMRGAAECQPTERCRTRTPHVTGKQVTGSHDYVSMSFGHGGLQSHPTVEPVTATAV